MRILIIFKPVAIFFFWLYRKVDDLRPDDSPAEVMILFGMALAFLLAVLFLAGWLFGPDLMGATTMIGEDLS